MHLKAPRHHGSPLCTEIIECFRECFEDLDSGDPARIARWHADPYFSRVPYPDGSPRPDITTEDADRLIEAVDKRLNKEIDNFPSYHERQSGANAYTEFHRLPPSARLGLAQRLARIADKYP